MVLGQQLHVGGAELEIEVHRLAEDLVDRPSLSLVPISSTALVEGRVAEVRQRCLEVFRRDREVLGDDRDGLVLVVVEVVDGAIDRAQELDIFLGVGLELVVVDEIPSRIRSS